MKSNYDVIEINIDKHDYSENSDYDETGGMIESQIVCTVVLNGEVVNQTTDYYAFLYELEDPKSLTENIECPSSYPRDDKAKEDEFGCLIPSATHWIYGVSRFYPFTCSCGVAGCAGIWDGIKTKHRKYTVEWRAKREDGYTFLPKSYYRFHKQQYYSQLNKMVVELKEIIETYPDLEDNTEYLQELLSKLPNQ